MKVEISASGSGSGSISQRHGSADQDPDSHKNVTDPQHWLKECMVHLNSRKKDITGTSVVDSHSYPDPHNFCNLDPHNFCNLDPHPHKKNQDPHLDPHLSDKLDPETDPDLHQFGDDNPKYLEYDTI